AGVSKMTFYKHFSNKIELALFILNQRFEDGVLRYKNIMSREVPFSEKAGEILKMKLELSEGISREMTKDILNSRIPEVAGLTRKIIEENSNLFLNDLISAQKKGEIRADINLNFIMYILGQYQVMATDERVLNMYPSTQAMTSDLVNFFFFGILSREKE
ncbi:MAG: TetR/AcrR family transcriptional regulator, partial [Candidatus Aminicenantes bacterium]|nr:TetR/AcrR family transcriptional regulator [Candidatus Aminicenantes bacterium]